MNLSAILNLARFPQRSRAAGISALPPLKAGTVLTHGFDAFVSEKSQVLGRQTDPSGLLYTGACYGRSPETVGETDLLYCI